MDFAFIENNMYDTKHIFCWGGNKNHGHLYEFERTDFVEANS